MQEFITEFHTIFSAGGIVFDYFKILLRKMEKFGSNWDFNHNATHLSNFALVFRSMAKYKGSEVRWNSIRCEKVASSVCHKILSGRYDCTCGMPLCHAKCCFISLHFLCKECVLDRDIKWCTRDSILSPTKSRVDHWISQSNRHSLLGILVMNILIPK